MTENMRGRLDEPAKATKIFVACPGGVITGGPELLHQLVFTLRKFGVEAYISYSPFDKVFVCPQPYEIYQCPQAKPADAEENMIVLCEMDTTLVRSFKRARLAIWWLSVDNYFQLRRNSFLRDLRVYFTWPLRGGRAFLGELRRCRHFCQSAYAADFLSRHGIRFEYLTDYLGPSHFVRVDDTAPREATVMYNPRKGAVRTKQLMKANPDIRFTPIQNMTAEEVRRALERAKVYVDLGPHPGKDRLPREAGMAGCCVITGRRGSAAYFDDVPIPDRYKLDDRRSGYDREFGRLVHDIFRNFEERRHDFDGYRAAIASEQRTFEEQVKVIFL